MFENNFTKKGTLTVISGCMFSGKTTELLRLLNLAEIADLNTLLFKINIDTRYKKDKVVSHNLVEKKAIVVSNSKEILTKIKSFKVDIVGIDEVQFFDKGIVKVIDKILAQKKAVIVAGLNLDFKAKPFGQMPTLLAKADNLIKVYAVCSECKKPATRTQRLINGLPASKKSPIILVGGKEQYTARCVNCHKVL